VDINNKLKLKKMSRNKLHPFYSVQVKNLTDSVIENVNLLRENQKGIILEPIFSTTTLEQNIFMFKYAKNSLITYDFESGPACRSLEVTRTVVLL
jgi:hypothetical protein